MKVFAAILPAKIVRIFSDNPYVAAGVVVVGAVAVIGTVSWFLDKRSDKE